MRIFDPDCVPGEEVHTSNLTQPIRLLVVDDHLFLREGVTAVIADQTDMVVVGEASGGLEAIERFRELVPDVTLMDLRMPDMNGIDAIARIRAEFPAARVIVLTTYEGDAQAFGALKAGAYGYLLKSSLKRDLLDAIRAVHGGKRRLPPEIAAEIATHVTDDALSGRELAVLRAVAEGKSNKLIAAELQISEHTVKSHMKSIFPKLNATDRTHAIVIALKRGIIEL